MSKTMTLDILTPERSVCSVEADIVVARALDGEIGILSNHAPLIAALDIAPLRYRKDGEEHAIAINGGFLEVKDNQISILTPTAETEKEIDFRRAEAAKVRAEQRLAAPSPEIDVRRAELALRRAMMRLKLAEYVRR
ncbi:MAG TPA: F0F1 ATP synthase subunit epsilon [Negativicutes bacterium]|nr:F0F1 ATP synthase subunit epsilon [Negativicutes bacterium]